MNDNNFKDEELKEETLENEEINNDEIKNEEEEFSLDKMKEENKKGLLSDSKTLIIIYISLGVCFLALFFTWLFTRK